MDVEREMMLGPLAADVCEARAHLEDATQAVISFGREIIGMRMERHDDSARAIKLVEELDRCKANYGVALSRYREVYGGGDDPRR